ncbi:OmpA family protein [Fulvivirga sp. M361]|uniref:OmpA family protein n=1 Tax=Fulvivirga sp. M361 TaxID=2594266 RepID=UPI00117AB595|nr:OmpA family protein [Fulvivirga sp. M361]TRX58363.1 OmpA family protein [Fulvivirga sp. M361]
MKYLNSKAGMVLFVLLFITPSIFAQPEEGSPVDVTGKIVDKFTGEPVSASIKYESLPYGSKLGIFRGETFKFSMGNDKDYAIKVEAEGYAVFFATLKAADAVDNKIDHLVQLTPSGADQLIRLDKLIFALGKAEIAQASYSGLDELVLMLNDSEEMVIQLEGHTDFRGNAKQNLKLSEKRVLAVKNYLVEKGVSKKRIKTRAFGGTKPLSRASDEESRGKNRRVEVRILSN